jgi:hypothetical protein
LTVQQVPRYKENTMRHATQLDEMTDRLTAHRTYDALRAACATGYAPTLADDGDAAILGAALELDGHRVFYRRRAD